MYGSFTIGSVKFDIESPEKKKTPHSSHQKTFWYHYYYTYHSILWTIITGYSRWNDSFNNHFAQNTNDTISFVTFFFFRSETFAEKIKRPRTICLHTLECGCRDKNIKGKTSFAKREQSERTRHGSTKRKKKHIFNFI